MKEKVAAETTISGFPLSCLVAPPSFSRRYTRIDPAQELSRIRHSLSLVEAYIYPHHRASLPRRTTEAANTITPKKEATDTDVKASSPGIVGTQTAGGFYAGPTSAATHLLMVCSFHIHASMRLHMFLARAKARSLKMPRTDSQAKITQRNLVLPNTTAICLLCSPQ